ncbi:hypothetical protein HPB47_023198 [Ixodes persulcatus]|uniref:Uncharacterized protein n=1 Tax=Ixodes persulcatus TaxID=34615 RepID=A0AC60Q7I5_IXOPE|nr:hypothetical protein HPB47_023198 [Ixodes persulcatus]
MRRSPGEASSSVLNFTCEQRNAQSLEASYKRPLYIEGQDAIDLLNTLDLSPEEQNDYDVLVKSFKEYRLPKCNERYTTATCIERDKKHKTCNFADLTDSLLGDQIVYGISSVSLREKVPRKKAIHLTLEVAIECYKAKQRAPSAQSANHLADCCRSKRVAVHDLAERNQSDSDFDVLEISATDNKRFSFDRDWIVTTCVEGTQIQLKVETGAQANLLSPSAVPVAQDQAGTSSNEDRPPPLRALKGTTYQVARLIAMISNRNYGMKESSLMRLVQAFVMSRLAYVVPFMRLGVAEKSKLECIVRKAYKRALGLPDSTSNEKLAALGVHNTIDELIEAQKTAQLERLTRSAAGRHILKSLGLRYETQRGEKVDVPLHIREMLHISPIPKHMHPQHDAKRREARAKALGRTLKEEEGVAYVDAAEYKGRGAMAAAVVNGDGHLVSSCSVKTDDPETAEEVAVALALSMPGVRTIVCDSQSAVRNFAKGRVSPKTLRVLRGATCFGGRERLVWTPAHASLPGNEDAHDAARGLTVRAGTTSGAPVASSGRDRLVTFRDILDHYTDGRRRFRPTHVRTIVCDSQSAVRNFAKGRVSPKTLRVLRGATCFGGRERHTRRFLATRRLTTRPEDLPSGPAQLLGPPLVTFRDILDHYTDGRRRFRPTHHSLNKRQSTVWRRLQTNTYPCPALLNRWYPDRYTGACKLCGQRANLKHMVWECSNIDRGACANKLLTQLRDEESWETTLLSSDPRVQEDLVRLSEEAAGVQGILAVV